MFHFVEVMAPAVATIVLVPILAHVVAPMVAISTTVIVVRAI